MQKILVYGAGGFGREVMLMLRQINDINPAWNVVGFFDDAKRIGDKVDDYMVLGGIDEVNALTEPCDVVIGIADPSARRKIVNRITNPLISFPSIVHPSVMKGDMLRNSFGRGSIITAGTIFTTNINVGEFVIINLSCTIGHDVVLENYCSIMPACSLSGFIHAEEGSYIGAGAIILPNIKIGKWSTIGAGAVVTRNVSENATVIGVPASEREFKER